MHYYVHLYYIPGNKSLKTKSFFTLKWVPLEVFCLLKLGLHLCWNCIAANGNGSIKWHSKNAAIISEFGIITARLAWLKMKRDQNRNFFFLWRDITFMQILVETRVGVNKRDSIYPSLRAFPINNLQIFRKWPLLKVRYYWFTKLQWPIIKIESSRLRIACFFSNLQANFPVSQIKINYIQKRSGDMPNLSFPKIKTVQF